MIDLALRYLGLGAPVPVRVDREGALLPEALAEAMDAADGPTIVCLQAGNVHSGAFDPLAEAIAVAHEHDAWVHVDGAFGLWAAVSPRYRHLVAGLETADSWATDAHKTLNVPYDCGLAIVARPAPVRAAFGVHTSYLITDDRGRGDPFEKVPELSRRARGIPVWAALRSLGRAGTVALVERLAAHATALAHGLARIPGADVLNDVVFTQVCVAFGDDERTREVTRRLLEDGTAWMSGSRWRDRDVLRISVSNWSTDDADIAASVAAVERAAAAVPARNTGPPLERAARHRLGQRAQLRLGRRADRGTVQGEEGLGDIGGDERLDPIDRAAVDDRALQGGDLGLVERRVAEEGVEQAPRPGGRASRASAIKTVRLPSRRSSPLGLPVTEASPNTPNRSSLSW